MKQNNSLELLRVGSIRHSKEEMGRLIEETGQRRFAGLSFEEIGVELGISKASAYRYYQSFIKSHEKEWLENKGETIAEVNARYEYQLARVERNYCKAELEGNERSMAIWFKLSLEALSNYIGFLVSCGFIGKDTCASLEDPKTNEEKEPINVLVDDYQQYLRERIRQTSLK